MEGEEPRCRQEISWPCASKPACKTWHAAVREKRHLVNRIDFLRCACMGLVEIAVVADDGSRLGGEAEHFFAQACGGFGGRGRFIPFNLEELSCLRGCPGGIGDNGYASTGV